MVSRQVLYFAMLILLAAIFIGAYNRVQPIFLAVGFIGEIILVATAHLSTVIQQIGTVQPDQPHGLPADHA